MMRLAGPVLRSAALWASVLAAALLGTAPLAVPGAAAAVVGAADGGAEAPATSSVAVPASGPSESAGERPPVASESSPVGAGEGAQAGEGAPGDGTPAAGLSAYVRREAYGAYLERHAGAARPDRRVEIPVDGYAFAAGEARVEAGAHGLEGPALYTGEASVVEWEVDVPEAGLYNLGVLYYPVPGRGTPIEREVVINGETLFNGAERLVFHRVYADAGPTLRDRAGNEIRPRQVEAPMWMAQHARDSLGYYREPYLFYFREGKNRLRLVAHSEPMLIGALWLERAPYPPPYAEAARVHQSIGAKPAQGVRVVVQGEHAARRSSPSLFAVFDQGDPTTEPYHPAEIRLNSIGGHRWQVLGDWIAWEFEVPEDGLYEIVIKAKQNLNRGTFSNRRVLIDGQVPFAELEAVPFHYSTRYRLVRLGDHTGEPFLFYLTKGRHELRMEAVLGELGDLVRRSEELLYELNRIYRSIIMITSATPDPMRSYQLERRVPGLLADLAAASAEVKSMAADLVAITNQRGGHTATLIDLARMLDRMVQRPDSIPNLLREYRDGIGNLGTWVMNTRNQPLQIDFIAVVSPGERLPQAAPSLAQTILHEVRAFVASFFHDYTGILPLADAGEKGGADPVPGDDAPLIKVWIGVGRDQAQVLKQMIEDTFTPETGIRVDLELVNEMQRLLVPATIAGTQPDVAIGVADMDLAFRGAVVDLAQFPDFEEVAARFKRSALLPFRFREHTFALPDIQSFPMLFYRKDILADLGLEVPRTWDDVFRILPELQNNHLEFGMTPSIYTYLQFLYQKGISLYHEDGVAVNLDAEAAIKTFEEMTNLYTQTGLPIEYNFINRFRMGEMPLAIANYGEYNTLSVFAPELRGEWGMAPVPGRLEPDGTINRTVVVAHNHFVGDQLTPPGTTGSIILAKSPRQEEAWEFLKWWTRTDTQVRFGREMEALLGAAARYATANVEAMQQLPWRAEERAQLNIQWDWVEGIPPVIGSYYVLRQFDWLFRAVVLQNEPVRESVLDYTREINRELERKRRELGFPTDRDELLPEWRELFWRHYTHIYRLDEPGPAEDVERVEMLARLGVRGIEPRGGSVESGFQGLSWQSGVRGGDKEEGREAGDPIDVESVGAGIAKEEAAL